MNNSLEVIWRRAIQLLLLLIPFLSLLVSKSMFFPFITGRNFGFRIIIEVAFVLWLGLIIWHKSYRPRLTKLTLILLGFLTVVSLADAFGVFSYKAFWSNFERMEGLVTLLHLGAYTLITSSIFRSKKEWLVFFNVVLMAGFAVALNAFFQKLGLVEVFQQGFRIRPVGTIGNPSYLAAYLILIGTVALYLLFDRDTILPAYQKLLRYIYGTVAVFLLMIVYLTGTRGAFLGLLVGFFIFSIFYLIMAKKTEVLIPRLKKGVLGLLIVAVTVPVLFFAFRQADFVQKNLTLSRYANISLLEGRSRFSIWGMALQGIKERPILGWGQEGFLYVFSKYYNPNIFDQEPWFDRTHDIFLDWLISAGILGLLSYLLLIGGLGYAFVRSYRDRRITMESMLIVLSGLLAYLIQNIFVFDNFNTYLIFFSLFAYAIFLSRGEDIPEPPQKNKSERSTGWLYGGTALGAILMVPVMYTVNFQPMSQSAQLIAAIQLVEQRTPDGNRAVFTDANQMAITNEAFKKIFATKTFGTGETIEQAGQLATVLLNNPQALQEKHFQFIVDVIAELEGYLERFPDDARMRLFAATIYNRANVLNPEFGQRAFEHVSEVLELNPDRQLAIFILAENYLLRGENEKAVETARRAVQLAPQFEAAQISYGEFSVYAKNYDAVQEVVDVNSENPSVLERIGMAFLNSGDVPRATLVFEGLVRKFPNNADFRARLADAYLRFGEGDAAVREAMAASELDPARYGPRVQAFIEAVQSQSVK
jgi:O-antigen ligase/tetratricopeptide (TPR) repeat protein